MAKQCWSDTDKVEGVCASSKTTSSGFCAKPQVSQIHYPPHPNALMMLVVVLTMILLVVVMVMLKSFNCINVGKPKQHGGWGPTRCCQKWRQSRRGNSWKLDKKRGSFGYVTRLIIVSKNSCLLLIVPSNSSGFQVVSNEGCWKWDVTQFFSWRALPRPLYKGRGSINMRLIIQWCKYENFKNCTHEYQPLPNPILTVSIDLNLASLIFLITQTQCWQIMTYFHSQQQIVVSNN